MKKKNKGFTLIELLAVIVILGLLMAIAIPSVTKYITQSRKKTLTNTIGNYMGALVNEVNDMVYTFTGTNTIYAVPIECIAVERGGTNPFGKWHQANNSYWAYVLVQYDDLTSSYKYGFTFKDSAGYGIYPTSQPKINEKGSQIVTGLNLSRPKNGLVTEITPLSNWTGFDVDSTTKLKVLTAGSEDQVGDGVNTCTLVQKGSNYDEVEAEKNNGGDSVTPPVENSPVVEPIQGEVASEKIKNQVNGTTLLQHTSSLANSASDNSYRFSGANPNNYVCFGSDEETCPNNNLYTIIGVFGNNIKLVNDTSIGVEYWNGTGPSGSGNTVAINGTTYQNYWYYKDETTGVETKATLNEYLNNEFYDSLGSKWQNMIVDHEWNIGGPSTIFTTAKDAYVAEKSAKWTGKIGLMSLSEYGYAAESSFWNTYLYKYDTAINWLYFGYYDWTITRYSGDSSEVFYVYFVGDVAQTDAFEIEFSTRPAFYLDSNVKIVSGNGEKTNPYRLAM